MSEKRSKNNGQNRINRYITSEDIKKFKPLQEMQASAGMTFE